ncbi:TonB-dependent receptor [Halarcobacter mediterraneus]|uniref:TonB-dependent receptor n=1 Tax=Halarcobacter mediterraneus TaxID=2023153 RepID=A0A4Q1AXR5_9BACT|nr:TonB-dependent receptor [Halarcobacter mediterraneus]RXK13140.1 TonB-dependent receptor [Halarcobacter mediterraneus]
MNNRKSLLSLAAIASLSILNANESTSNLGDITVTSAAGYEQKLVYAPASISVITQEDLNKKAYTNLLDAVKDIEGVDIGETTDKSGQGTISVRGMGSDYTLVLIDGRKQNNNGDIYPNSFGGLQFANIPPLSMIERIEVVRGPMSTLYGADAMGGVINIITKKIANEWSGSITKGQTFQTESYWGNQATTDVAIIGPIIKDKLGISIRGSYYDKEESKPQWDKDSFNNNGVIEDSSKSNSRFGGNGKTMDNQNWTFGTGLTFTPNDNHTIRADFDIAKQKYDNTTGSVGTIDSYDTIYDTQRVGYAEYQRMEREQYSLSWEADWSLGRSTVGIHHIESKNLGRSLPLTAEQRQYIEENKSNWADVDEALQDPVFAGLMPRPIRALESKNTTFSAKYELPLENHYIVMGAEYLEASMKDGVFGMNEGKTDGEKEYYQYSAFIEDSWNITDPLTFTIGARYDKHEDFGSHVSPRAYLTYVLNDSWTIKGGVATGYKTPKTSDLQEGVTGFGGQGTSPWIGNPDLQPEESLSKEIAVYYEHPDKHNFNITVFQNDFEDKIESDDAIGGIAQEWLDLGYDPKMKQNVGEAEILGLEIAGKYFILDNLSIKMNWTYMDSEIQSDDPSTNGRPLTSSPKHMYSATLDYQIIPDLNTYLQYRGEKDRFNSRYKSGTEYKDLYYKDYSIWNLGASYKVNKNLTFNGRVNNLFDKNFMEYNAIAKGSGRTPYYYEQYSNISAGRNFWISLNYTF